MDDADVRVIRRLNAGIAQKVDMEDDMMLAWGGFEVRDRNRYDKISPPCQTGRLQRKLPTVRI